MMNGMMKMILQQTETMKKQCIKVHVGVSAPNGDWATIICTVMKAKHTSVVTLAKCNG